MKADDRKEFLLDLVKGVTDKINNENFSMIGREEMKERSTLLPGVWKMKKKRDINIRQINRRKDRINVDGSIMKKWIHYEKVY